ncbi:MAG: PepSY domain-containing protein [Clostridia bacterium]|nr:PepSY domain-containing protein [Clostridia bacterium]
MKKKLVVMLAGVVAISSFAVGAMSKSIVEKIEAELRGDFTVYVDGKKQTFRDAGGNVVDPVLYEGTTYLPVRAIGELMGKTVYWYQDEKKIELIEPSGEESLVTDADVIVDTADKKDNKVKEEKPVKQEAAVEAEITLEEAKAIALEKAGLKEAEVFFEEARLDRDDGRLVYDIEFRQGWVEYNAEIDALSGKVLEWEKDVD